jgi:hypothetical protein
VLCLVHAKRALFGVEGFKARFASRNNKAGNFAGVGEIRFAWDLMDAVRQVAAVELPAVFLPQQAPRDH